MDYFKLGLRNILGISLPGAIIIIVFLFITIILSSFFQIPGNNFDFLEDKELLITIVAFIFSYILGSLIRLKAADIIDKKSGKNKIKENIEDINHIINHFENDDKAAFNEINKSWNKLKIKLYRTGFLKLKLNVILKKAKDKLKVDTKGWYTGFLRFDDWIYYADNFPYTLWEFRKFEMYHPKEFLAFFDGYKSSMIADGKGFFNYCKMVILASNTSESLKNEVYSAEAFSRFLAGTYFALFYSIWMLVICSLIQIIYIFNTTLSEITLPSNIFNFVIPIILAFVFLFSIKLIIKRYRNIRLKEVDIVYDAFYLVHKHTESCSICSTDTLKVTNKQYFEREKILKDAFLMSQSSSKIAKPIELKHLIDLIKKRCSDNEFLSSLYFAGSIGDHPYFIKNDKIAIGLSVLPEDSKKAGKIKLHPEQTEIIIVIDGSILLEVEEKEVIVKKVLTSGDYFTIDKNTCHKISAVDNQDSAFVFIKTNPNVEPNSLECKI